MIDFFWGDENKTDEIATTPTARNQNIVVQPDQSQSQAVITQPPQVSEIPELEFGADLRLLFNQIIWYRKLGAYLENKKHNFTWNTNFILHNWYEFSFRRSYSWEPSSIFRIPFAGRLNKDFEKNTVVLRGVPF